MTRSQAIEVGNLWQSSSGEVVRITYVAYFTRIHFVKYVTEGLRGAKERTLDHKAFLHRYHVREVAK